MHGKSRVAIYYLTGVVFFLVWFSLSALIAPVQAAQTLTTEEIMTILDIMIKDAEENGVIANEALISKLLEMAEKSSMSEASGLLNDLSAAGSTSNLRPGPAELTPTQPADDAVDCFMKKPNLNQDATCALPGRDPEFSFNVQWQPRMNTYIGGVGSKGHFVEIRVMITNLTDKTWDGYSATSFLLATDVQGVDQHVSVPLDENVSFIKSKSYEVNQIKDIAYPGTALTTFLVFDVPKETTGGQLVFRAVDRSGQKSDIRVKIPLPKFIPVPTE